MVVPWLMLFPSERFADCGLVVVTSEPRGIYGFVGSGCASLPERVLQAGRLDPHHTIQPYFHPSFHTYLSICCARPRSYTFGDEIRWSVELGIWIDSPNLVMLSIPFLRMSESWMSLYRLRLRGFWGAEEGDGGWCGSLQDRKRVLDGERCLLGGQITLN